jgi:hypothetical protein
MGEDRFSVIQMTENDETFMDYDMTGFLECDSQDSIEDFNEIAETEQIKTVKSDLPRLFQDITNGSPVKEKIEEDKEENSEGHKEKKKKDKKKKEKKENKEKKEKKPKKEKIDKTDNINKIENIENIENVVIDQQVNSEIM